LMTTLCIPCHRKKMKSDCDLVLGIDNVQVGAVPEPTSFTILALGGMALLARRRRRTV
jgi:PEP-CTERM motif